MKDKNAEEYACVVNGTEELAGAGGHGGKAGNAVIELRTEPTIRCEVCGVEFYPLKEDRYISREEETCGAFNALTNKKEVNLYDTFDCPQCGCQNIVSRRLRKYEERKGHKNEEVDS